LNIGHFIVISTKCLFIFSRRRVDHLYLKETVEYIVKYTCMSLSNIHVYHCQIVSV